jgi:cell division protein FtsZ
MIHSDFVDSPARFLRDLTRRIFMINLSMADPEHNLRPRLTVVGVGGAGGNAINNMIRCQLEGCDFIAANTDSQALGDVAGGPQDSAGRQYVARSGRRLEGRCRPRRSRRTDWRHYGLPRRFRYDFRHRRHGRRHGHGALPVIARAARDSGILTVGVVTKPFHFEGNNRMRQAEAGIAELQQYVDTLIVIPNQNLFRIANERTTFAEAFRLADEVLHCGVRGITDLMVMPGFMNLDFADVKTVMGEMGKAMMGTGEADGDNRAIRAAEAAISNPLLDDVSMKGARGVLINITGGMDMTLFEVDQAANRIREEVDPEAQIKVGSTLGENLEGKIRVSVIATGIDACSGTHYRTAARRRKNGTANVGSSRRSATAKLSAATFIYGSSQRAPIIANGATRYAYDAVDPSGSTAD